MRKTGALILLLSVTWILQDGSAAPPATAPGPAGTSTNTGMGTTTPSPSPTGTSTTTTPPATGTPSPTGTSTTTTPPTSGGKPKPGPAPAPGGTSTSTSTSTAKKPPPPPPPPVKGEFYKVDPKYPGICLTKYDQQYPCAEIPPPPPTVTGVVKPVEGGGRADEWKAGKYNSGLYDHLAAGDEDGKMTQGTALTQYDKVLLLCIGHNVEGRPDDLCTVTPSHPECSGLKQSLQHATNCAVPPPPGSPADAACKGYGAVGYVIDEWLVFGEQYYNGMGGCLSAKEGVDKAAERAARLENLTEASDLTLMIGGRNAVGTGASTITGKTKVNDASTITQSLSEKFDDGAEALGYERGELFTRAIKGQPFFGVFNDSPFAQKLGNAMKDKIDAAFANPGDVRESVKEKRLAEVEKIKAQKEAAGESTISIELAQARYKNDKSLGTAGKDGVKQPQDAAAALEKSARVPASASLARELEQKSRSLASAGTGAAVPAEKPKNWLALTMNADGQVHGRGVSELTAPAAPLQAGLDGDQDISLFKRVSSSYRRIAPSMGAYGESKTARDVRLTDTPEFFRDL